VRGAGVGVVIGLRRGGLALEGAEASEYPRVAVGRSRGAGRREMVGHEETRLVYSHVNAFLLELARVDCNYPGFQ
jgi:hypothetical protein